MSMRPISWKTGFFAFTFVALASLTGGVLTACSTTASQNQSQAPNTVASGTSDNKQINHDSDMMNHGGMNHSMAMDLGPADANYDLRFIDAMTLHHRGAIAMAKEAEQKSQRSEIKKLARNIIVAQSREENELLQKWRKAWYPQASAEPVAYDGEGKSVVPMSKEQQKSMTMLEDLGSADAQFDLRFMNAMIAHHEGAVIMAQDALNKSKQPEIKQLAQEIIDSQQAEINQMKQWRQAWYNK
ncbi:DUF305 domain-containing protein [Chlorogloeopsis sp. ULAP01]|uniref:DUF305 domain-containing protein n=1 Tax=Chlorogloeopsis TaxID=1123 RepID=UPI0019E204F5|nr:MULTISPECIES: DUF305 domain-containing protein [Chlorogloeopsis]MBF2004484.1 DUF305 domain-containing protein [Chlorogloeopsis fritschii C42_A2020_084]MDM9383595.1 DUF305 domain-containing protein [Chlorogloeopsis sp. ULAP01]